MKFVFLSIGSSCMHRQRVEGEREREEENCYLDKCMYFMSSLESSMSKNLVQSTLKIFEKKQFRTSRRGFP